MKGSTTFAGREDLEERYAWPKFRQWLKRGGWNYKRFRYPKDITDTEIDVLQISEEDKIKLKQMLKTIDFDHDGMINRGLDTWFFDLKYKNKSKYKTLVNEDSYKAYFELSRALDIPFILVVYVHEEDKLYFHRVRDPKLEPKPRRFWDKKPAERGGQKWVYDMPESEYWLVTGFSVPWKVPKNSLVEYYIWAMKVQEAYESWLKGEKYVPKPNEYYRNIILKKLEDGMPKAWLTNPLYKLRQIKMAKERKRSKKRIENVMVSMKKKSCN